jgi:hypothetical protein
MTVAVSRRLNFTTSNWYGNAIGLSSYLARAFTIQSERQGRFGDAAKGFAGDERLPTRRLWRSHA